MYADRKHTDAPANKITLRVTTQNMPECNSSQGDSLGSGT